jgi:hypothetical protein
MKTRQDIERVAAEGRMNPGQPRREFQPGADEQPCDAGPLTPQAGRGKNNQPPDVGCYNERSGELHSAFGLARAQSRVQLGAPGVVSR